MNHEFPPLIDPALLPLRVLCIAPHPDDEVFGCGGALALHAARGARVRVVVLSDGTAGESSAVRSRAELRRLREDESRRAGRELGIDDMSFLALKDGALGAMADLVEIVRREVEAFEPELVYSPSPFELHPDHRAAGRASVAALVRGPKRRVMLYGVNTQVPATALVDITGVRARKRAALECFRSQLGPTQTVAKIESADRARTINIDAAEVEAVEGYVDLDSGGVLEYQTRAQRLLDWGRNGSAAPGLASDAPAATAVICTWNKVEDLCENLDGLRAQTLPFESIVVVDNASEDGTAARIGERYPEVRLIVMPHSKYGACETFNIGFASSTTPLTAILDDDVVLPPEWLERSLARLAREPESTAILSTEVIEPGMPDGYVAALDAAGERYMSTFRGCASLARTRALREVGGYDERLFIYGNERDLTCRLLLRGYRVLHYPAVRAFHKTPFGIKAGRRSLYYHARNAALTMLKYAPASELLKLPWQVLTGVVLRSGGKEEAGQVADATGTIGIRRSLRETPGAWWVLLRAGLSVLGNVPYCLAHRDPLGPGDYQPPLS